MSRFIALHPSEESLSLLADYPNAWLLLCQIAMRAKWKADPARKLEVGEAFIGDFRAAGLKSEQTYRTAKKQLQDNGLATFRATNKGTVAKLINSRIFSLSVVSGNEQNEIGSTGQQRASNDPANRPATTNHTENTEHTEHEGALPFPSDAFRDAWRDWKIYRASKKLSLTDKWKRTELRKFAEAGEDASVRAMRKAIQEDHQGTFPAKPVPSSKFFEPTDREAEFGKLVGRSRTDKWTQQERDALEALGEIGAEDLQIMREFYHAEIPRDEDRRRQKLLTLLQNWPGEMDKARAFTPCLL